MITNIEQSAVNVLVNSFCPTGEGGGIDPSCSAGGGQAADRQVAVTSARRAVVEHGIATGLERLELLHHSGLTAGSAVGEFTNFINHVTPSAESEVLLLDPRNSITAIHNHPGGTSLNSGDIQVLAKYPGLHKIEAITHDRKVYVAVRGPRFPSTPAKVATAYERAYKAEREKLLKQRDRKEITHGEVNRLSHHKTMLALHAKGLVNYSFGTR